MASQDPTNTASGSGKHDEPAKPPPPKDSKQKDDKKDEDLSDEDLALKQQLELYGERVQDSDPGLQKVALESMRQEIRTSTSSMTSVQKPLKYFRPHYGTLKPYYETMTDSDLKIPGKAPGGGVIPVSAGCACRQRRYALYPTWREGKVCC